MHTEAVVELTTATLRSILIVGNQDEERAVLRHLLVQGGEAISSIMEANPDSCVLQLIRHAEINSQPFVFLTSTVSDGDALDLLQTLRGADDLPPCPVVVVSRYADSPLSRVLLRAGAQDVIGLECFTPHGLRRVIMNATEHWAMARERIEGIARFQTIFEHAAVGIARLSLDGRFVEVNQAFCRMHGYTHTEMLEMRIQQLTHPQDWLIDSEQLNRLVGGELAKFSLEKRNFHKNGTTIWVTHTVSLERRLDGTPHQFISTVQDITDRKLAEQKLVEANRRLSALTHALPVGVSFSEDATCEHITGNPAVLAQFAVSSTENLSASAADHNAPGRKVVFYHKGRLISDAELPLQRAVAENRTIPTMELEIVNPDGRRWYAEAMGAPIRDENGDVEAGVAVTVDVTARKLAELQLLASEAKFSAAMQSMSDAVFISDKDGRFVYFNQSFATIHKFASIDECKRTFDEYPAILDVLDANGQLVPVEQWVLPRALRGESGHNMEVGLRRKDTGESWIGSYNFAPIRDENGAIVGSTVVARDITLQKHAELALRENEARLRMTLESGSMGTFELNVENGQTAWNKVEFELLGLNPATATASVDKFFQHVHPDDLQQLQHEWNTALKTGKLDTEFRIIRADGTTRWLAGKGAFFTTESSEPYEHASQPVNRFLGVNYDITARRQAEHELRSLNTELEERVAVRTAQLESANGELEAFSYSVSHDMRAPLRAIDGFARILLEDHAQLLPPEGSDCLQEIMNNAKQMGRLIDDLLSLARLGRQAVHKTTVSVNHLVRQCIVDLNKNYAAEFQISDLPSCVGDPALLKQVWLNLLENALKYTRRQPVPMVEITAELKQFEVIYSVKDNGVGFDMRYAHKLFGVFQRLHRQEDYEGTGVGLAIVQRVIHRHGGRVWAQSQPNMGATFHFSLPLEG